MARWLSAERCMRLSCRVLGVVCLCVAWFAPCAAEEVAGAQVDKLTGEVAGLRRAAERVTVLLDQLVREERLEVLLKRIELKERRLAPIQNELRAAQEELLETHESSKRLWVSLEEIADQRRRAQEPGSDEGEENSTEALERDLATTVKLQNDRLAALEPRIRSLEGELSTSREEIRRLEELLSEEGPAPGRTP